MSSFSCNEDSVIIHLSNPRGNHLSGLYWIALSANMWQKGEGARRFQLIQQGFRGGLLHPRNKVAKMACFNKAKQLELVISN